VLWPREAAPAKNSDGHLEVTAEFLAHDVRRHLGRSKQRVQAGIDRHRLIDSFEAAGVVVSFLQFHQRQRVRAVAVDFIGAGEAERRVAAEVPRRNQKVHRPHGVHVEILVRNGSGFVMGWLRRGMNDELGPLPLQEIANALPVADVGRDVAVPFYRPL
jgi:hypothetical protein